MSHTPCSHKHSLAAWKGLCKIHTLAYVGLKCQDDAGPACLSPLLEPCTFPKLGLRPKSPGYQQRERHYSF